MDLLAWMGIAGTAGMTAACAPHGELTESTDTDTDTGDLAPREAAPEEEPHGPPDALSKDDLPPIYDAKTGKHIEQDLIRDPEAAVALGKALFWDMQAGSDGVACASCHYSAGADTRVTNQLSPGLNGGDKLFNPTRSGGGGPGYTLTPNDYPFHVKKNPNDRNSPVQFDTNDVTSSQGVFLAEFEHVLPGERSDVCTDIPDPVFSSKGANMRRVEPRNTPTVLNSGFNFRNFWDGRANRIFNGCDPFGPRNKKAFILENHGGVIKKRYLRLVNASLASQAVGPLLNDFEMSCSGRTFPDVGRKLLHPNTRPLHGQKVDPQDSVLGARASMDDQHWGLDPAHSYSALIEKAFEPKLWQSDKWFDANKQVLAKPDKVPEHARYTMKEINFNLFWGVALEAYQRTLVSDQSPFDRYRRGEESALSEPQRKGLDVFMNQGRCINCHDTAMFTKASTLHLIPEDEEGGLVERMLMSEENFHYGVRTQPPVSLTPYPPWKKSKKSYTLSVDVEGTPSTANGAIVPGAAKGRVTLVEVSTKAACQYTPTKLTFGVDKTTSRDVRIEANRTSGADCPAKIRIDILDDVKFASNFWLDLVLLKDGGGNLLSFSYSDSERVGIRQPALYDNGFYNIGVRPTKEDLGVGGKDPFGNPLSFTEQYVQELLGKDVPDDFHVDPCRFEIPFNTILDGVLFPGGFSAKSNCDGGLSFLTGTPKNNSANNRFISRLRTAVKGAFKVPTLRNVALTAPYMHNGGMKSLEEVVEFYNRGGDFHHNVELDPDIRALGLNDEQRQYLVAFLRSLTDPRVVYEREPFDHPQLLIPNGPEVPAVGKDGRQTPISTFLGLENGNLPPK